MTKWNLCLTIPLQKKFNINYFGKLYKLYQSVIDTRPEIKYLHILIFNPYSNMINQLGYNNLQWWSKWPIYCKKTSRGTYDLGLFICLYLRIDFYVKIGVLCAAGSHFESSLKYLCKKWPLSNKFGGSRSDKNPPWYLLCKTYAQ